MYQLKQSSTARPLLFLLVDSADHVSGKTGATPTVTISKNGGSFASPSGTVTELSGGWYKVAGNATDTGTLGPLLLHATASGADPTDAEYDVVAYDPHDAVRLGLTALPNANAGASGGLPTGNGSGQVTVAGTASGALTSSSFAAGAVNAAAIADGAIDRATFAADTGLQTVRSNTAQAGAAGTITLDAAASSVDDFYTNQIILITGGTGIGQARIVSDYVGSTKVASVNGNWATAPDNTSTFALIPFGAIPGATAPTSAEVADAVWDEARSGHTTSGTFGQGAASVQGNVTGSVGSVMGAVGSVTGAVGSVTGNVGGNVVGSVASVTGNVGGNVTGSVGSLGATAKSDVNAEVLDVLNVDTFAEIGQETPAATQTLRKMLAYLYKAFRNRKTQTSSQYSLYNDDGTTVGQKSSVADDGTTTTVGELGTGP